MPSSLGTSLVRGSKNSTNSRKESRRLNQPEMTCRSTDTQACAHMHTAIDVYVCVINIYIYIYTCITM